MGSLKDSEQTQMIQLAALALDHSNRQKAASGASPPRGCQLPD